MATDGGERRRRSAERQVLTAAVMALTVVAGVGVMLVFPRPEPGPAPPVELARPAPVGAASLSAWPLPLRRAPPVAARAPAEVRPPPLRTRRLETAQTARPHPLKPMRLAQARVSAPPAACRAPQTPADRLVCGRPELGELDLKMRAAYDRALAAGADRLKVDRAQAQWRGRRDRATSEDELSQLYARRIAELDRTARIKAGAGAYDL